MHWDVVYNNLDYFLWGAFPKGPLGGLAMSIVLALLGIFGAFWIGLAAGLMRLSRNGFVRWPATVYIEVVRGTPLLMLIFWFYFLAPILFGHTLPAAESALTSFIVFTGAYVAEIVRAGVLSLPKGQMEAARGSGLSHVQAMSHVILPQSLRNMIPSFVNQFVSLTKDTSLAYIIGVDELMRNATQVNNRTYNAPTEIFITVAVLYFIVCFALTSFSRRLEKHIMRYQARNR
jgi:polar amino acid transport system permease protein